MTLMYSLVSVGDEQAVAVFVNGRVHAAQSDSHPNWKTIVAKVLDGDESVVDDFDVAKAVAKKFERLSARVTVANGRLYFDGDEFPHEALTEVVLRSLDAGSDQHHRVIAFIENVMDNPEQHSREQLYEWLLRNKFGIDDKGYVVGYKSVYANDDGTFRPTRKGPGIVDGVEVTDGYLNQRVGSVVEMARSQVVHDPSVGCSVGLHISNYDYAASFSGDTMLRVSVNPRDIVSVPTDSSFQKVRASRYTVVEATPKSTYTYDENEFYYGEDDEDEVEFYEDYESENIQESFYTPRHSDYRYNVRGADGKFTKRV